MLPLEHSAILLTFIKLPFVIKICVLSIFEWSLKTGFTVSILVLAARYTIKGSPDKQRIFSVKVFLYSYPSVKTYDLGAQKNRLIETVLLSTHNICFA